MATDTTRIVNLMIAISDVAQDALRTRHFWDEDTQGPYTGPVQDRTYQFFKFANSHRVREGTWRTPTLGGKVFYAWSLDINLDELPGGAVQQIVDEIDFLETTYASDYGTLGAWFWDGRQVGTQWVDPDDPSQGVTGTPRYPILPQIYQFAPAVPVDPPTDPVTFTDPTDITGLNVTFGQAVRLEIPMILVTAFGAGFGSAFGL